MSSRCFIAVTPGCILLTALPPSQLSRKHADHGDGDSPTTQDFLVGCHRAPRHHTYSCSYCRPNLHLSLAISLPISTIFLNSLGSRLNRWSRGQSWVRSRVRCFSMYSAPRATAIRASAMPCMCDE